MQHQIAYMRQEVEFIKKLSWRTTPRGGKMIKSQPEVKIRIIKGMICQDNNLRNIRWLCEIAGVSRSGYYRWMNAESTRIQQDAEDKDDFEPILKAYQYSGYDKGARTACPSVVPGLACDSAKRGGTQSDMEAKKRKKRTSSTSSLLDEKER